MPLPGWNQRWRDRRDHYRPAGETIDTRRYEVAVIETDAAAKAFILTHHYSGTYPAARVRIGLYRGAQLVGVAVFSHPCHDRVLTCVFPEPVRELIELGRFVLCDDVPGNGETWFLSRCFHHLRAHGIRGVVSFSDPVPRVTADGRTVFRGHLGTIYQACNGRYLGRGTARRLRVLPTGQILSDRAVQKLRSGEKGWRYVAEQLQRAGASPVPLDPEPRAVWLREQLPRVTRAFHHPGNHRYAWALDRDVPVLKPCRPYPKVIDPPGRLVEQSTGSRLIA